ncbi:ATP-binding protein [Pedobacter frigoris]|uniref:ATP-binding protein n=1 Tax=Pedobacter frigoris TaxID=2571272 RepID=UPI00292D090E|nr:ATP-binding protein [Pedobacter frigoris]
MDNIQSVSIKFRPGTYGVFRNLQNKVWYAVGEYVDNAVQSYENNKEKFYKIDQNYQFEIRITVDWEKDEMVISDNAAGINSHDFIRAFEPANIPIDNTGLHEFGMGMKTASIWLSNIWILRTAAIGEVVERTVVFDLNKVLDEEKEILDVLTTNKEANLHFTEITLKELSSNAPTIHQMTKLRSHLSSIYRKFIRSGQLILIVNDEILEYDDPEILIAPIYTEPNGTDITWKKEIDFRLGKYRVAGFVGLLRELSTSKYNGLSLFRRGRVIEGSHDEKYTPKILFGQVGSFRYKRLFGELELEGFEVSFNKGSFQEQGDMEALMESLKIELSGREFNLLKQADEYRKPKQLEEKVEVAKQLVASLGKEERAESLSHKIDISIQEIENHSINEQNIQLSQKANILDIHKDSYEIKGVKYLLKMELINEPEISYLYEMEVEDNNMFQKTASYKINLSHPLFSRFEHQFNEEEDFKPIILIIRSLVIAEIYAPSQGTKNAGNVRMNFNTFLRHL